jgi:uncharacterized RmlC-like cupin family protein
MLRVSKVDEWLNRAPTPPDLGAPSECVVIRSAEHYDGKQGVSLAAGVSSRSAGAQALCLHVVTIPPGTRGVPHVHTGHESAIYTVSGETEVWHGENLQHRTVVGAGDFMYIPPGTPHLPVNRSDVMTIAVVARTDPQEQESVRIIGLPPHLAELSAFPIASQELPLPSGWRPTRKSGRPRLG